MRKYQPIWLKLKQDYEVSIQAPVTSHARIIQAVRKEKCKDAGWRLLASEKGRRYRLTHDAEDDIITFSLKDSSL